MAQDRFTDCAEEPTAGHRLTSFRTKELSVEVDVPIGTYQLGVAIEHILKEGCTVPYAWIAAYNPP